MLEDIRLTPEDLLDVFEKIPCGAEEEIIAKISADHATDKAIKTILDLLVTEDVKLWRDADGLKTNRRYTMYPPLYEALKKLVEGGLNVIPR